MFSVDVRHFLVLSGLLFVLGIVGITSRKNTIGILFGIELVLISASINFITFSKYIAMDLSGHIFTLFIFVISVSESVVALAIILRIYQNSATVEVEKSGEMKC